MRMPSAGVRPWCRCRCCLNVEDNIVVPFGACLPDWIKCVQPCSAEGVSDDVAFGADVVERVGVAGDAGPCAPTASIGELGMLGSIQISCIGRGGLLDFCT